MSIRLEQISYVYSPNTPYEKKALDNIDLKIPKGQFVGIIGHTGSGKSTLIQHMNGLLRATTGSYHYNDEDVYQSGYDRKKLRSQVGMVFQYPEHQLFEVDVLRDVSYGPKNLGKSTEEAKVDAKEALRLVGMTEEYYGHSPFELSGGQKRRVAIAGVLAMKPKVIILDEPTAGLDPRGRDEILQQIKYLHEQTGITVILVSHSMEDIARYVGRLVVMNEGRKRFDDTPVAVFSHYQELEAMGLAAPQVTYILHALRERGLDVSTEITAIKSAAVEIAKALGAFTELVR